MPSARKGRKRPAEPTGNAVRSTRIAMRSQPADDGKDPAAKSLGSRGGKARARALSAKQRQDIARKAARSRWDS